MNAIAVGPLAFSIDRFAATLAIIALFTGSEIVARRVDRRFSTWGWRAFLSFIAGARFGHVAEHLSVFMAEPWRIFAIWQGGFNLWSGIGLAALYTLAAFRAHAKLLPWLALPLGAASFSALVVLWLAGAAKLQDTPNAGR